MLSVVGAHFTYCGQSDGGNPQFANFLNVPARSDFATGSMWVRVFQELFADANIVK